MFHELLEGILRALTTPGRFHVVVNDAGQKEVALNAIPGLAEELKENKADVSLHLTDKHPVGTVLTGDNPEKGAVLTKPGE